MSERTSPHGMWSSRWAFVLAATGSAVGLGNIWKFPYIAGENGGGAFVLIYILCILLIGVPVMMAEVALGRRARRSPIRTFSLLAEEAGASRHWRLVGWMALIAGVPASETNARAIPPLSFSISSSVRFFSLCS